jgi:hypothetical protein
MLKLIVVIVIIFVGIAIGIGMTIYYDYKDSNKEIYYIAFCNDAKGEKEYGSYNVPYPTFEAAEAGMYTRGWKYHVVPISKGVGQWREGNKLEQDFLVVKTKKKKDF